jgi:hypothetical protein
MKYIDIDWDDLAESILSGAMAWDWDYYIDIDLLDNGWLKLSSISGNGLAVEATSPPMTPTQETALGYLRSTGLKPTLFEVAELALDKFVDEAALTRHICQIMGIS